MGAFRNARRLKRLTLDCSDTRIYQFQKGDQVVSEESVTSVGKYANCAARCKVSSKSGSRATDQFCFARATAVFLCCNDNVRATYTASFLTAINTPSTGPPSDVRSTDSSISQLLVHKIDQGLKEAALKFCMSKAASNCWIHTSVPHVQSCYVLVQMRLSM